MDNKWFKLEEKIPEHLQLVLAYDLGDIVVARYYEESNQIKAVCKACDEVVIHISHWMYLPDMPDLGGAELHKE
jgi:hypothetical protein